MTEVACRDRYFFFFNDTATTEIYTLSLHDALPISAFFSAASGPLCSRSCVVRTKRYRAPHGGLDRKSTRLNSSHANISYAVFCLKKKKIILTTTIAITIPNF